MMAYPEQLEAEAVGDAKMSNRHSKLRQLRTKVVSELVVNTGGICPCF